MKNKKLIIVSGSILAFVLVCIILSFTLFSTHSIEFNFHNNTTLFVNEQKQLDIINSLQINKKMPIYSLNKTAIKNSLESNNAYLKVINIETVFPNKLVLHCAEREEVFCIESRDGLFYFCDEDLKILNCLTAEDLKILNGSTTYLNQQKNCVILKNVDVLNSAASVGDFLELYSGQNLVLNIVNAFAYNNKSVADIKSMFKSISLKFENNVFVAKKSPTLEFVTYDDFVINIRNADSFLINKINYMLNDVPQLVADYKTCSYVIDINPNNASEVKRFVIEK